MLVVLALLQLQGTLSMDALERDRQSLFEQTRERGGYLSGDFDSSHLILFPARRSDVLFYLSTSVLTNVVTCWERVAGKPVMRWQIPLKEGAKGALTSGSLARLIYLGGLGLTDESPTIYDRGLLPDRNSAAWRKAKPYFEQTGSFVSYDIRIHGDISLGSAGYLIRSDGTDVERFAVDWGERGVLLKVSKTEFQNLAKFKRRNPCQGAAAVAGATDSDPCS